MESFDCRLRCTDGCMESFEKQLKKAAGNKVETNERAEHRAHVFASKVYYFVLKVNKLIRVALPWYVALACVYVRACVCVGECPHLSEILDGGSELAHVTQSEPAGRKRLCIVCHLGWHPDSPPYPPPRLSPLQAKLKLDIRRTHNDNNSNNADSDCDSDRTKWQLPRVCWKVQQQLQLRGDWDDAAAKSL